MSETVLMTQRVWCGAGAAVRPLAVGISGTRIDAVVPLDEADSLVAPGTRVLDLGDSFLAPGFADAHEHVCHAALFPSAIAAEFCGTSEADCVARMQELAERCPGEGWLVSHGWREQRWERRIPPTRHSLDEAFPTRPVCLYSGDSHTVWLNTAGLAALGIDLEGRALAGGRFDVDENGLLTGVLREETGMKMMSRVLAELPRAQVEAEFARYLRGLASMGITSVSDLAISLVAGADGVDVAAYEALLARDELPVRVHLFPVLGRDQSNLEDLQARLTGELLRAPGFKQFFDGVSSQHTAWCSEPYVNPRYPGDCGVPTVSAEEMRELVMAAAERGHSTRIHAIGDRAVEEAVRIFHEAYLRFGAPTQGANTVEHLEDVDLAPEKGILRMMREAGIVASVQPPHVLIYPDQPLRDLGAEREARMWPFREFVDAGVAMAFGTDAPVVPPTSTEVLFTAVTRQLPEARDMAPWHGEHAVSREEALVAYTQGSAAAVGRAHELGRIEPSMLADLAAWDTDLLACGDEELLDAQCVAAFVGGTQVHG